MSAKPSKVELPPAESEFVPTTQEELRRYLAENHAGPKRALAPVGGRTALDFGFPLCKPVRTLSLASLNRVVDFPARDMTVTIEAGMRIDRLAEILRAEGQRLPIDVAQSNRATIGGAVATDTSGPRRFGLGTFRDYVIGLTAATADGRLFHSGGRVVKNVAGYDLCKLMVGSLGTLAIITQLTLKLKPAPEASALVAASFQKSGQLDEATGSLLTSATRPVAIESLNPPAAAAIETEARVGLRGGAHLLLVGVEGSRHETDWQVETLQHELAVGNASDLRVIRDEEANRLWTALTEFPTATDEPLAFQANLLPSRIAEFEQRASAFGISLLCHAGNGTVIGKLPDEVGSAAQAAEILGPLAALAEQSKGSLVLLHCEPQWQPRLPVFNGRERLDPLMRKLKQAFDPEDLLNPGRLFASA